MARRLFGIGLMLLAGVACGTSTPGDGTVGTIGDPLSSTVDAYVVTSQQGDSSLVTYVSTRGAATTQFGPDGLPIRGAVVSYVDGTTLGLDYSTTTYVSTSLTAMVDRRLTDLTTFQAAVPEDGVVPPPVSAPVIVQTTLRTTIGGVNAHAYDLDEGNGHTTRVWYAEGLPLPPDSIRQSLAALEPAVLPPPHDGHCDDHDGHGGDDGHLGDDHGHGHDDGHGDDHARGHDRHYGDDDGHLGDDHGHGHDDGHHCDDGGDNDDFHCDGQGATTGVHTAGRQVLRIEALTGSTPTILFDTSSVTHVRVPASTFAAPAGWTTQTLVPFPTGPVGGAFSGRAGFVDADVLNAGIVAEHPEIYVFYWGSSITDAQHSFAMQQVQRAVDGTFSTDYTNPLLSYGVHPPVLKETLSVHDDPPSAIGGDAVGAHAGGFVIEQGFEHSELPRFWWEVGGHDPIYAILVPADVVETGNFDGFHFMVHTFADLELPFPVNLFTHIGMPYMVVKVPAAARDNAFFLSPPDRIECALAADRTSPKCVALDGLDGASRIFSHELVEASTDPEPFLGNSDLLRNTKAFAYGEIADICATLDESDPFPFASMTLVGNVAVSTYWEQIHQACVPSTQPSITITNPVVGTAIGWQGPNGPVVPLNATVNDPAIGLLPGTACSWTVDGINVPAPPPSCATSADCFSNAVCSGANLCFQTCGPGLPGCNKGGCDSASGLCRLGLPTSFVSPPLPLGGHVIHASYSARDDDDPRKVTADAEIIVFVTALAPTVSIDSPANGALIPADQFVTLRGSAFDTQDGPLSGANVQWTVNGVNVGDDTVLSVMLPGPGNAVIDFTATNSAGVSTTATRTVHVIAPTGLPSVTILAPTAGENFFWPDQADVTFRAVAVDADGTRISDANIEWSDDVDGALGTGAEVDHQMSGSRVLPILHTVTVTVTGANGTQTDSVTYSVGEIG